MRIVILLLFSIPIATFGGDFERDFTVVFITKATEARHGNIPLDRALIARAMEKSADAGAKGVILKFFLDQSKTAESDRRIADAISRVPVLLQARIENSEKAPNPLGERFFLPDSTYSTSVSGNSGWIPLPQLSRHAHDVCFVDFVASPVPIVETYQGKSVKSLLACAAELALGQKAVIRPAKDISIAGQTAPLDPLNRVTVKLHHEKTLPSFDFNSLIDGSIPTSALRNRVVLIGYDGPGVAYVSSPIGNMGAHRLFVLMLREFYERLVPKLEFESGSAKTLRPQN